MYHEPASNAYAYSAAIGAIVEAFDGSDWWPATIINVSFGKEGGCPQQAEVHYSEWVRNACAPSINVNPIHYRH